MWTKTTPETLTICDRRPAGEERRISPFVREMYRLLLDQIELKAWTRVLSVECGNGWAAEEAWRRVRRGYVCGVDISPKMIELAQRLRGVEGQLEFRIWDGKKLPFPEGSFDCVIATFAFHRYVEPATVLREIRRVLRSGCPVLLLEPDRKSFRGFYSLWDYFFRITDPGHVRYYSATELLRLMEEAGFQEATRLMRHERLLYGGKFLASAVIVRARREARVLPISV